MGRRRWQISTTFVVPENVLADAKLRIMRDFEAEREWVLEQGDMLYLPPNIAHHGVALEPCMTYSIGFRAPTFRDIVSGFSQFLLEDVDPDDRYSDQAFALQDNPGEISAQVLHTVKHIVRENLETEDDLIESWFGRFITEPKPQFNAEPSARPLFDVNLLAHLNAGGVLERNAGSRFAYVHHRSGESALFVDGQEFVLGPNVAFLAPLVCRHRVLDRVTLQPALDQRDSLQLVLDLTNAGFLVIYEDE
jgi:50S ribosomal protein L16 3-hydroxylase